RHPHVRHDGVELQAIELGQGPLRAEREDHVPLPPEASDRVAPAVQERLPVVHHQDREFLSAHAALARSLDGPSMGSRMRNVVPCPGSDWSESEPPCFSTTTERAIASPCPVPLPTGFVVKNGSKMRSRMPSGIPAPVSSMVMSALG